jgi:RND family efflux transporter MFP subunit
MRTAAYALSLTALFLAACSTPGEDTPSAPTPVRIAEAAQGPAAPPIRTNGMLANRDEIRLSFKVGGVIATLPVNEGDRVRRGQKLAEIEQTEIDAQVEQARQAHEKAKRDAERGNRLHADKVISLEQLQDLKTQAALMQAALHAAEFNRNYAAIIAPHDGTVLRRLAEERELVAAGAPILVLGAQQQGFVVRAGLADREIVQVKTGDLAEVRLDALPEETLTGTITEVASASDPASGLFTVEVAIAPSELPLKSGLVAKLTISPSAASKGSRVYVPIGAIVEGDRNRASVFVLEQDRAIRREVEVAFIEGERVALRSGVENGEQVITDGALYLEDGEHVSVQQAPKRIADSG